jgi:RNA 3'-terminal phosphate cyclase-like protein
MKKKESSKRPKISPPSQSTGGNGILTFTSPLLFRMRLVLSCLSQLPIVIQGIREVETEPGLNEAELCFARALAQSCDGSKLVINDTGTRIHFRPGMLTGGLIEILDIPPTVHLGWIIEGFLPLCPFFKLPLDLHLNGGLTDSNEEVGVNHLQHVSFKVLERFLGGIPTLTVKSRGFKPLGGGSIHFTSPTVKRHLEIVKDLHNEDLKVLRIRGVAQGSRVNPQLINRLASASRSVLEEYSSDVFVQTDSRSSRTKDCGNSPGYSLTLWAELVSPESIKQEHTVKLSIAGILSANGCYAVKEDSPEVLAKRVSLELLNQIKSRSSVDSVDQSLLISLMATSQQVVIKANFGIELSEHAQEMLRLVKRFLGVSFQLSQTHAGLIQISCLGNGVGKVSRNVT